MSNNAFLVKNFNFCYDINIGLRTDNLIIFFNLNFYAQNVFREHY